MGKEIKKKVDKELKPIDRKSTQPANLTGDEAAIFQRIKSEAEGSKEWETISEKDLHDYSLGVDPFKLPAFAKKMKDAKQFAFRWVERKKERLDEIRSLEPPKKWWIVNASTIPESESECDPILGCVTRYDQLLVFKPYWMFEVDQRMKREIIDGKDRAGDLRSKHKQQVDETGSEMLVGDKFKIDGKADVIMADEEEFGNDDLEDLVDDNE